MFLSAAPEVLGEQLVEAQQQHFRPLRRQPFRLFDGHDGFARSGTSAHLQPRKILQRIQNGALLFGEEEKLSFFDAYSLRQFFPVFENRRKDPQNLFRRDSPEQVRGNLRIVQNF